MVSIDLVSCQLLKNNLKNIDVWTDSDLGAALHRQDRFWNDSEKVLQGSISILYTLILKWKKCVFALCKNAPRSSQSWFSPPRKYALVLTHSLGEIFIAVHFNVVFKIFRWLFPDCFYPSQCRHDFIPCELMLSHTPGVESYWLSASQGALIVILTYY